MNKLDECKSKTLVLLKPDCLEDKHVGRVISRLEDGGLEIYKIKRMKPSIKLLKQHYAEHDGKPFFDNLVKFMHDPVIAIWLIGDAAVGKCRQLVGNNNTPGTIRGDFATSSMRNIIHASDSDEAANRELGLWF